jgi:integrase
VACVSLTDVSLNRGLSGRCATIDRQIDASDEAALVGGEEHRCRCELICGSKSPHRNHLPEVLACTLRRSFRADMNHGRLRRSRANHVRSDATADDYVFPSFRLKGKKPLSASIMVQKYLRPAAVKAGVIKEDQRVRFGFHNFRHSLASSLVKLKCDPKTVQGILRHEDVRTTMQLYAQSDQESRLEAQGKFLALLLGDKAHLLTETTQ